MKAKIANNGAAEAVKVAVSKAEQSVVRNLSAAVELKEAELKAEGKTEEAKAAAKKTVKQETEKKETMKKAASKRGEAKTTGRTAARASGKTTEKKAAAKKAELKTRITLQFYGKSYSEEELIKTAKDIWKFDLKRKAGDLESVELYVKPEEDTCYYVMNGEAGSFSL